jgi:hypothetical protein
MGEEGDGTGILRRMRRAVTTRVRMWMMTTIMMTVELMSGVGGITGAIIGILEIKTTTTEAGATTVETEYRIIRIKSNNFKSLPPQMTTSS